MRLRIFGLFILFFSLEANNLLIAQNGNGLNNTKTAKSSASRTTDSLTTIHLLRQGEEYLLRKDTYDRDLDSALLYFNKSYSLSLSAGLSTLQNESLCYLGQESFQRGKMDTGRQYFCRVIEYYHTLKDSNKEAETWMRMGYSIHRESKIYGYFYIFPETPEGRAAPFEILQCFEQAYSLYQQLHNIDGVLEAKRQIADIHLNLGKLDQAENEFLEVLETGQRFSYKKLQYVYDLLSITSRLKGNYNKSLLYSNNAVNTAYTSGDTSALAFFYIGLAYTYHELGDKENSIKWFSKSLQKFQEEPIIKPIMYRVAGYLIKELIDDGKPAAALEVIKKTTDSFPPYSIMDKETLCRARGDFLTATGKLDEAENEYIKMIGYDEKIQMGAVYAESYLLVSKFFSARKKYKQAEVYLKKLLNLPPGIAILANLRDAHFLYYEIDSAGNNWMKAAEHLRKYIRLSDSISNQVKIREIEELQIQYATSKKENDIKLLEKERTLHQSALLQAKYTRNWILGGVVLLLIIMSLMIYNSRMKQRTNKKLGIQQKEISKQNLSLRHLLNEKDWLVKEIHHRVKNNFHTVISLLGTQSAYLKNDLAKNAITDSQRRVHSMSLIHQKLYQTDNLSAVNMSDYIHDLVDYLSDSFNIANNIRFSLQIDPIALDISHSIPLGLILNEAITNSFKYAFPDNREGIINISFKKMTKNHLFLTINDNGIGLPPGFNSTKSDSMGMNMMLGLSEDIGAKFIITGQIGTRIEIEFVYDPEVTISIAETQTHSI